MIILITVFILSIVIQVSYWFFLYVNVSSLNIKPIPQKTTKNPLSLVICVKNEVNNIRKNFQSWKTQLRTIDELVIVDDFSSDPTLSVVKNLTDNVENIQILLASKDSPGKKQAITDAIQQAKNDYILFTDADCQPGPHWSEVMSSKIKEGTIFVLGYAPFFKNKSFLNVFQRFECLLTAIQYFSFAKAGKPYMGVGRNLLFKKEAFHSDIYSSDLASGDDDLLVSKLADKYNTEICIDPETFVYSRAKDSWKAFIRQKLRHISTSVEYKPLIKLSLLMYSSSQILSNLGFALLLFTPYWNLILASKAIDWTIKFFTLAKASAIFKEGKLFLFTPILDFSLTLYYLLLFITFPFKKKTTWN